MAPANLQHRRTHNLLLVSKILSQRDGISPFTLVLDNLEQSGKPLLSEFIRRANASKILVILVSFETLRKPEGVDVFITTWSKAQSAWQKDILNTIATADKTQRKLLIFDSLNTLAASELSDLPTFLSSFTSPATSLLSLYHIDVPETSTAGSSHSNPYSPSTLTMLRYLATTILNTHSLHHVKAKRAARNRSLAEPVFGLEEDIEGIIQGLGANPAAGVVMEMEHRRKSGRGVREWYYLPVQGQSKPYSTSKEIVILLEDHPDLQSTDDDAASTQQSGDENATTFELGLTERQRLDREGIVLPYFDAQKGGGEGGRILYDMGEEDDFDEEEDEI